MVSLVITAMLALAFPDRAADPDADYASTAPGAVVGHGARVRRHHPGRSYVTGSSGPTDGAVDTLLAGRGVCRDYAHLAVALRRAMEIPARMAAVYAPGLDPMDFHAVAEALVEGAWYVADGDLPEEDVTSLVQLD